MYLYDLNTQQYSRVTEELAGFTNPPESDFQVFTLRDLNNEKLFIGTDQLIILDLNKRAFKTYSTIKGIDIQSVNFVHIDKNGFVWFDINNAYLVRMEVPTSTFQVFGRKDGLPNIRLLEAHYDKMGNLWISSNKGLFQLIGFVNSQDSLVYNSYDKSDNLQSLEFQYHAKAVSPVGEIFFGGINGFNSFYPENVVTNPYPPNVHIIGLRVANNIEDINEKIYGKRLLIKPMIETNSIKIHYKIKVFTIEFVGLHFVAPESNQFQYILEGYDDHWTMLMHQ